MRSDELVASLGFQGSLSVGSLQEAYSQRGLLLERIRAKVPARSGVYVVVTPPGYVWSLRTEVCRGKHLCLRAEEQEGQYHVLGTDVVYIGKAGGPDIKATMQDRIYNLIRHGLGATDKHKGGERIWLLERDGTFLLYWKECDDSPGLETQLIQKFKRQHNGQRPFGNRRD